MAESLSQKAYDILLERIFDNRLPAGEMINRRELAAELRMSVAPVLEAMVMLERDGLLETLPRKGTRVAVIRSGDISGHLFVREALECHAARQICGPAAAGAMESLIPLARRADAAPLQSAAYAKADFAFHTALVALCGCDLMNREYERVARLGLFYRINRFVTSAEAGVRLSHERLLEQMAIDDPQAAHRAMRDHLVSGKGGLVLSRA